MTERFESARPTPPLSDEAIALVHSDYGKPTFDPSKTRFTVAQNDTEPPKPPLEPLPEPVNPMPAKDPTGKWSPDIYEELPKRIPG